MYQVFQMEKSRCWPRFPFHHRLCSRPASAFAGKEQQRLEQRMFQTLFAHQSSIVDKSPVGKLSSHAFKTRRMIFPLRVFGSLSRNSISRGAA